MSNSSQNAAFSQNGHTTGNLDAWHHVNTSGHEIDVGEKFAGQNEAFELGIGSFKESLQTILAVLVFETFIITVC